MKLLLITAFTLNLTIFGCEFGNKEESETIAEETSLVPDEHTSENALDWNGTYEGVIPCADCPGIATKITLHEDKTYELSVLYQEREKQPTVSKGSFTFDETGSSITLDEGTRYKVKEGCLALLDGDGKEIEGALKANYVLNKNH
ncbi:copper resistance protein NlpE [Flavobacterium sp.]|uniref:copper resistance protein NlpE n=1 Tax=Flavobacterium sp. TaxID=239 RepID=UPI0028BD7AA7|nr:copper resistance protein NlpE [Flavobacterium sp.]